MILGSGRSKTKNSFTKDLQAKATAKMAPTPPSYTVPVWSHRHKLTQLESPADSEEEQTGSQSSSAASDILKQFEKMLNKALKQTSEQITSRLTKEIRELGNRTAALELKVDEIEITAQETMTERQNLKEENVMLQSKLEDFENRARRSNLRITGIPE